MHSCLHTLAKRAIGFLIRLTFNVRILFQGLHKDIVLLNEWMNVHVLEGAEVNGIVFFEGRVT